MKFGWINLTNGIILVLLAIPYIYMLVTKKMSFNMKPKGRAEIATAAGSAGCIVFMIAPVVLGKFGFETLDSYLIYNTGNSILLLAYFTCWFFRISKKDYMMKIASELLPAAVFMLNGVLLYSYFLVVAATVYGAGRAILVSES